MVFGIFVVELVGLMGTIGDMYNCDRLKTIMMKSINT